MAIKSAVMKSTKADNGRKEGSRVSPYITNIKKRRMKKTDRNHRQSRVPGSVPFL